MLPGDLFAEKFRIIERLGQGGTGCVYLAENLKLGSHWAIKEIPAGKVENIHFLSESNILKKLEHPALPRIYDIIEENGNIYFIIDYIEGVSLDKMISQSGSFTEDTVLEWARQLCEVLAYLHSVRPNPVIYRDMKPSNIILTKSGRLKLVDFGAAREYKDYAGADTVFIGTRGYAAPEQYGRGQSDEKTDIYSLGVTLHHLLTGKGPNEPPYEIRPVRLYKPDLSEEIESLVSRCTRQDPGERYGSSEELLADINRIKDRGKIEEESLPTAAGASCRMKFKRLVLTVWDNSEFGCELAYMAAKKTDCSVLLIDLDLLAPKADLHLNLKKFPGKVLDEGILGDSGLNIVIEAAEKNMLTQKLITEVSARHRENPNLFVLTGNYRLDNYEYFNDDSLLSLIDMAYSNFDITVLLAGKWIYDSYTVVSLAKSDFNIVPVHADIDIIREYNNYIAFMADKQHIASDKAKFVAYEYMKDVNITKAEFDKAVEGNFIGCIGYSRKRAAYRNQKSAYAVHMEKEIQDEYIKLLKLFNIVPMIGFKDVFLNFINRIMHICRG